VNVLQHLADYSDLILGRTCQAVEKVLHGLIPQPMALMFGDSGIAHRLDCGRGSHLE
jgi:hypothetical protein